MGKLLRATGEVEDVKPKNGKHYTLRELQGFVGGSIELIQFVDATLVVNEEGKIDDLPYNPLATAIYHNGYKTNDFIAGDAFLCEPSQIQ